jgi:protein-tyrosine phosphatase
MIDLHSHIIPGIDDGPKNITQSMKLAQKYREAGYHRVVATPHYVFGSPWMPAPEVIRSRVDQLNQAIQDEGLDLIVFPGMEVAMDAQIGLLLDKGRLQTLADKSYVLVETPFQRLPYGWKDLFFDIISRGYRILLAHPERCAQLGARPKLCNEILASGVYFQINWISFLGFYGREVEKLVRYMAKHDHIHCLATDSHDTRARHPGRVKHAQDIVENLIGKDNTTLLARRNPARVFEDKPLISMNKHLK